MSKFKNYAYYMGTVPTSKEPAWVKQSLAFSTYTGDFTMADDSYGQALGQPVVVGDVEKTLRFLKAYADGYVGFLCHAARDVGGTGMVLNVQAMLSADGISLSGGGFNVTDSGFPWWLISNMTAPGRPSAGKLRRFWAWHAFTVLSNAPILAEG